MTEAEFDRRLQALIKANLSGEAMGDLDGFADLFTGLKNVFVKAGSAIASGVGKVASSAGGIIKSVGSGLASPGGASLVSTAGSFLVAKQAAKIEESKIALQTALINQGYMPVSSGAQSLLDDVASQGVIAANGRVLIPGVTGSPRYGTNGAASLMSNPVPWLLGGLGLLGIAVISKPRGR